MRTFTQKPEAAQRTGSFSTLLRFAYDISRIPVHASASATLQRKLQTNTPGDAHEQEADRIAERVMHMSEAQLQRTCACGGGCPRCKNEQAPHERLQTKHVRADDAGEMVAPPIVHDVLRSSGQPMDPFTREFMEPRFGRDFTRVRIHVGPQAAHAAQAVKAKAFTVGTDVVFGEGRYAPETHNGQELLAHELAHVAQQQIPDTLATAGVIQRQAVDDDKYDVVKFGAHGEANLYRLSLFYDVPFAEVKRLNSRLEKDNWAVHHGDLINLPAGTLAKLKQPSTAEPAGVASSTSVIPTTQTSDEPSMADTLLVDTVKHTEVAARTKPPTAIESEKKPKEKTASIKNAIPKTSTSPAVAQALLHKYASFVLSSDFYIPYSLNEKGLGKELAHIYSGQPAVVHALLDLVRWADRDDVSYEMARSLYVKQLLDPTTDKTMLQRLRDEVSASLWVNNERQVIIDRLDQVLQFRGDPGEDAKTTTAPGKTWGEKFLEAAKEYEGADYDPNYCSSKDKMKQHGVCNELVFFAVRGTGAPMYWNAIGHPDWYKTPASWNPRSAKDWHPEGAEDWNENWDPKKNPDSGWILIYEDVKLQKLIDDGGTTEGEAAGLHAGDLIIHHDKEAMAKKEKLSGHVAFYVKHGIGPYRKRDIFIYDSNAWKSSLKGYERGVRQHTVLSSWNVKKVVSVYRYAPK